MSDVSEGPSPDRLESWKEIAGYLRRDIRTVQRWEQREGLPVHRHMHADRATVWASVRELEAWLSLRGPAAGENGLGAAAQPAPGHRRRLRAPAGLLLVATTVAIVWLAPGDPPLGRGTPTPARGAETAVARLFANLTREGGEGVRLATGVALGAGVSSPDGRTLYVSATSDNLVLAVDTASMTVSRRITVKGHPGRLAVSPDGRQVFVGTHFGRLHVLETGSESSTVIETGGPIADVLATHDGRYVYLALQYAGLARLEVATGQIQKIPTVGCPMSLAADRDRLYVSHQCRGPGGTDGHDAVGVFDLATGLLTRRAQGPPQVGGAVALSPDGAFFWLNGRDACLASRYDHRGCPAVPSFILHVFNTVDLTPIRTLTFPVGDDPGGILVLPGGSRAFVGGRPNRVFDTRDFAVVEALNGHVADVPIFSRDRQAAWLLREHEIVRVSPLPSSCDLPPIGLMDHWPADGSADDIRAGFHGKRTVGNAYGPGVIGQAFAFDGKSDEILVGRPTDPDWAFASGEGTLLAWVKFASLEGEMPLVERTGGAGGTTSAVWRLSKSKDNRIVFCMGQPSVCEPGHGFQGLTGSSALRTGAWYHVAVTRRQNKVRIYINGRPDTDEVSVPLQQIDAPAAKRFGVDAAGRHLHGLLDEVAHYTRALEAREIEAIVANVSAPACVGSRQP